MESYMKGVDNTPGNMTKIIVLPPRERHGTLYAKNEKLIPDAKTKDLR